MNSLKIEIGFLEEEAAHETFISAAIPLAILTALQILPIDPIIDIIILNRMYI